MAQKAFHHALTVNETLCYGCTRCMTVCPTAAIRMAKGKAKVDPWRCVDCGNCMEACPVNAIVVGQDDFQKIFHYSHRVAVVPSVMIGQFSDDFSDEEIFSALLELGFTHVYEAEFGSDILRQISGRYPTYADQYPVISSFCPAVVRLIQVRFPSLVKHLNLIKPPLDITALFAGKELMDGGAREEDIGIFYVTPCASKIAAIKSPQGERASLFTGVINMDYLFNLVRKSLVRQKKNKSCKLPPEVNLSPQAVLWSLTTGEAPNMQGRSLAVDGINNVIEFLEKFENGEINGIDFLELRACDEGCAGGILGSGNRFLTAERLRHRAKLMGPMKAKVKDRIKAQSEFIREHIKLERIEARSIVKLDDDFDKAMDKMEQIQEILKELPQVDCGICGSPSCEALANDIVQGTAEMSRCIFYQRRQENLDIRNTKANLQRMIQVWGSDKFT